MPTYKELVAQAQELMRQAEAAREAEISAVISEIRAKMDEYGITVADLAGPGKPKGKGRAPAPAKYRHPNTGETWSGRGRAPRWLADEMANVKKKEDFLVD